MKISPQISADLDEYPELAGLVENAVRRVAELMELHDILELRRIRKTGVFNHPYDKDVVTPIGVPSVPKSVAAVRYPTGRALLDYLSAVGVSGIALSLAKEEVASIDAFWRPPEACPAKPQEPAPEKAKEKADTPPQKPRAAAKEKARAAASDNQTNKDKQ